MALDVQARRTEGFRILRQGLEYALSEFVEHLPGPGFEFLTEWAAVEDPDVRRIVKANLGKARLRRAFSDRVLEVLMLLGPGSQRHSQA
jgi:hypothetical protein